MYISRPEELESFCKAASASKVLAIDTEFLREKTYYPKLCLIQVATKDASAAIDPLALKDLGPLSALLADQGITKVFHACSQDLEVLYDELGVIPTPLFDTQVAAAFLGQRHQIGYGQLVEAYTGVRLAKAQALTDWSRRPLDSEQLSYAEDDVRYLPGIYEKMMGDLTRKDRLGWVLPEMEAQVKKAEVERDPRSAYLHLKRMGSLTRKQLAVAREVAAWREKAAAKRNIPRRWVLSDELVIESCRALPRDVGRLRKIRGTEQLSESDCNAIVRAVARGVACKNSDYPHSKRTTRPSPETEGVIDLMYAVLRIASEKSGVAAQVIASKDDLLEFMQRPSTSRLSQGWRYDLVGKSLASLLAGELGLTVKDGRVEVV